MLDNNLYADWKALGGWDAYDVMPTEPYVSDADKRASNPTFAQDPYMF